MAHHDYKPKGFILNLTINIISPIDNIIPEDPRGFGLMVNGCVVKALLAIGHQFKSLWVHRLVLTRKKKKYYT